MLGIKGTRDAIQKAAPSVSPIQDAVNRAGGITLGVRKIPKTPGQAPKPEGFGGFPSVPNPPTSKVPLQRGPIRTEPGFTRGGSKGVQLQPGAIEPSAAERFGVEGQLRIPFTQPGRGGQMYSPGKSSKSADVAADSMRQTVGDVLDAADFPRFRGAEGQRAMDLEPSVTREMMQRMAPGMSRAPGVPDPMRPMGVQMMDLSQIDPRVTGAVGAGALAVGMDRILRDLDFSSKNMPVESQATAESQMASAQEAARMNELISTIVADASQQGGVYGELVLENAPRDPSSYKSPEAFRAAQVQFLNDAGSGIYVSAAEQIEQGMKTAITPQSEQSGENITTETLTSELGSDDMANAVGAGQAEAEAQMLPAPLSGSADTTTMAQGAADLAAAATPRPQPELRMASSVMMQSIADDIGRRLAAEEDVRNQGYIQARNNLGPNATQAEMDKVRDMGLALFAENFPQFR